MRFDPILGEPAPDLKQTRRVHPQWFRQVALEAGRPRGPRRVPSGLEYGVVVARGKLPECENHEVLSFSKFNLTAREYIKALRIEKTGSWARKKKRMINAFVNHRHRLVGSCPQQACRPFRGA